MLELSIHCYSGILVFLLLGSLFLGRIGYELYEIMWTEGVYVAVNSLWRLDIAVRTYIAVSGLHNVLFYKTTTITT